MPVLHSASFRRNLNAKGLSATGRTTRHVSTATQTSGVPLLQVRPAPLPRTKRALPNPTSIFADIVTAAALGLVTGAGEAGDVAADFLILGATVDLRAGAGAVSLVAGAGVFSFLVVFFIVRL